MNDLQLFELSTYVKVPDNSLLATHRRGERLLTGLNVKRLNTASVVYCAHGRSCSGGCLDCMKHFAMPKDGEPISTEKSPKDAFARPFPLTHEVLTRVIELEHAIANAGSELLAVGMRRVPEGKYHGTVRLYDPEVGNGAHPPPPSGMLEMFNDEAIVAEYERRGLHSPRHERDIKALSDARKANVTAIRDEKIRQLPSRLREAREHTMGEIWQKFALGEMSVADAARGSGHKSSEMFAAWFEKEFGLRPDPSTAEAVRNRESGPGISRLPEPATEGHYVLDVDLLCDDE